MEDKSKFRWLFPQSDVPTMDFFRKRGYSVVTMFGRDKGYDGVVFTGGEDVTPFLYGEGKHSTTICNLKRDLDENNLFRSLPSNMPKVGICRGAQFLNVMSGGSMWQDVNNHCVSHLAKCTLTGELMRVTSTHHQMMRPADDVWSLMVAKEAGYLSGANVSYRYKEGEINDFDDVESVFYYNSNAFCFQPHPEYKTAEQEMIDWFWDTLESTLFEKELKKIIDPESQVKKVQVG
jgi:phosphoribosylformylglycinamidine (FGAM) synthase-like amidotransferase family enzyme